jgi:hypothetical protein
MKIEFNVIKLLKVKLISWKIYMIMEFFFNIEKFKEQTKIDKYCKPYANLIVIIIVEHHKPKYTMNKIIKSPFNSIKFSSHVMHLSSFVLHANLNMTYNMVTLNVK